MKLENIESLKSKVQEIKAYCSEPCLPAAGCDVAISELDSLSCYLREELAYLYRYISNLDSELREHKSEGHCPKIPSATAMQKVLDVLGLSEEYIVEKKYIYSSVGKIESESLLISKK